MRSNLSVILACMILIAGCSEQPQPTEADSTPTSSTSTTRKAEIKMRDVTPAAGEKLSEQAYLRERLPDNALGYLRVPSVWATLGTAKGSIMDKSVASEPYRAGVKNIREGVAQVIDVDAPDPVKTLLKLLFVHTRSAVEAVPLAPRTAELSIPELLISAHVDFETTDQLNAFLTELEATNPEYRITRPMDAKGYGTIIINASQNVFQVLFFFDAAERRLFLLTGLGLQSDALETTLNALQHNNAHPMHRLESSMDSSGQGLFFWLNPAATVSFLEASGLGDKTGLKNSFGGKHIDGVALGVGTVGGKHRAKLVVEMPRVGFRNFIPTGASNLKIAAAGELDGVGILGFPSSLEFKLIETTVMSVLPPNNVEKYRNSKQKITDELGFGVADVLSAIGPELVFLFDEAGDYTALRIRDKAKFNTILKQLVEKYDLVFEQREINGSTYYHLVVPQLFSNQDEIFKDKKSPPPRIVSQFFSAPNHFYWREEGDYILLGAIPQVLIDRDYIQKRTDVHTWLTQNQKIDPNGALLLGSKRNRDMPKFFYHLNLQIMQFLADSVERPVDMFLLPSAMEAELPEYGAVSALLSSTDKYLALEMTFDNNPAELLMSGGGMGAVAATGILAAIALPAYQDYTIRAKIAEGLSTTTPLKTLVRNTYLKKKQLPTEEQMTLEIGKIATKTFAGIQYDPTNGRIILSYNITELGEQRFLVLTPQYINGVFSWACNGSISNKYLPSQCRAQEK